MMNMLSIANQFEKLKDNFFVIIPIVLLITYPLSLFLSIGGSWMSYILKKYLLTIILTFVSVIHFLLILLSFKLIYG